MKEVKIGELVHVLDAARADGTAKAATDVQGLTSASTLLSTDSPTSLAGARSDPEGALKALITLLAAKHILTDATTAS
jgi:hypothetical protein